MIMTGGKSSTAALDTATLVRRGEVARDIHILDFEITGGHLPESPPQPGQFYLVDCDGGREHLLRRPMSVHEVPRWEGGSAMVRFLVEAVGWGTRRLASLDEGSKVGMLGPLGRGFDFPAEGSSLVVAGGMGVAPLFFLCSRMDAAGIDYDFVAGFRNGETYYPWLGELGSAAVVLTEDGSVGLSGTASAGAKKHLEDNDYASVYTCGPEPMMASVAGLAEAREVQCQVSLISRMACGIGACRGCVRRGRDGGNLCVCTDGPVFDSKQVEWHK